MINNCCRLQDGEGVSERERGREIRTTDYKSESLERLSDDGRPVKSRVTTARRSRLKRRGRKKTSGWKRAPAENRFRGRSAIDFDFSWKFLYDSGATARYRVGRHALDAMEKGKDGKTENESERQKGDIDGEKEAEKYGAAQRTLLILGS